MKKILLSGYYGFNNAGDEAVLASIVEALREEIPGVWITVLSNSPELTAKLYGVQSVNRWHPMGIISAITGCDLLISGGGSLLQDVTGWKSILYYLAVIQLAHWLKRPVMFYAQGIGPVNRSWARRLLAWVVNRVQLITVRDEGSRDELTAMGVSKPPVIVTADPVLGWSGAGSHGESFLCRAKAGTGPRVGVSLRDWPGINPGEFASLCDWLAEKDYQVVFLPFQFPGDIGICREVACLMHHESCLVKEKLTAGELMDVVGCMDMVIGMRLHALIMAAAKGIPFVAVSYDPKVERFACRTGASGTCQVAGMTAAQLIKDVEHIFNDYSLMKKGLTERGAELKEKARENARLVRELLETVGSRPGLDR